MWFCTWCCFLCCLICIAVALKVFKVFISIAVLQLLQAHELHRGDPWIRTIKTLSNAAPFDLSHESVMLRDVMVIRAIDLTRAIPNLCWHFVTAFVLRPVFRADIVSPKYIQSKNNVFLSCHGPPKDSKQFNMLCASSHSLYSLWETALLCRLPYCILCYWTMP